MSRGAELRSQATSRRAAKLRRQGMTLGAIAKLLEIPKAQVQSRIMLGERLLSLEEPDVPPTQKGTI